MAGPARPMKVGALEIVPVWDGYGVADPFVLWGKSDDEWAPHREHLTETGQIRLDFGGFLIRSGDATILVDTGYGPDPVGVVFDRFVETGRLLDSLAWLGVRPDDVTHVLFTHLHSDHLGWATTDGTTTFPKAEYRCHVLDREFFFDARPLGPDERDIHRKAMVVEQLAPLGDRFTTWDRDETIAPGVDVVLAAGHTPGSTIIVASSGDERAMLLGDIVHCPVELTDPEWGLIGDVDPQLALRTREQLTRTLERDGTAVASGHFPGLAFGRVLRGAGRRRWVLASPG